MENNTTLAGIPASPTTTQSINSTGPDTVPDPTQDRLQELPDVIEFCKVHGFPADVVGRWVWIQFDSKPDADTRTLLKAAGFRWVKARMQWAHNCGYHSRKGKGNPRWKYGSVPVSAITRDEIKSLKGAAG